MHVRCSMVVFELLTLITNLVDLHRSNFGPSFGVAIGKQRIWMLLPRLLRIYIFT